MEGHLSELVWWGLGLVPISSYVFPVAVVTNHHQHSGLKQQVCIIFHFWWLKYIKSSCCCCFLQNQQGCVLSRSSRIYFFDLGSFQKLPALPDLWPLPPPSRPATQCLRILPSALHLYYHLSFSASDLLASFLEGPCDYTVSTWTIQDHLPTTRSLITCTKSPRSWKPIHPFTGCRDEDTDIFGDGGSSANCTIYFRHYLWYTSSFPFILLYKSNKTRHDKVKTLLKTVHSNHHHLPSKHI